MLLALIRAVAALLLGIVMVAGGARLEARAGTPHILETPNDSIVCALLARAAEKALGIPEHLLRAVGVVESGRYDRTLGRAEPWPWTINAAGKGATFRTKAEAVAEVARLQNEGVSSIDVGCMQVNLAYHGDAFESLDDAFDPVMNVAYAAHFLDTLKQERGSWSAAVAAYHSSTPKRALPYRQKVVQAWHGIRGKLSEDAIKLRRSAVLETYEKRRAEFAEHQARVLEQQKERREARKKQHQAPSASGVIELRGGTPQERAVATPANAETVGTGSLAETGRDPADAASAPSETGRLVALCPDVFSQKLVARLNRFNPALARRIREISARDGTASLYSEPSTMLDQRFLSDGAETSLIGPVNRVTAAADETDQTDGPRLFVEAELLPRAQAAGPTIQPANVCPRIATPQAGRGPQRATVPSVIRG